MWPRRRLSLLVFSNFLFTLNLSDICLIAKENSAFYSARIIYSLVSYINENTSNVKSMKRLSVNQWAHAFRRPIV